MTATFSFLRPKFIVTLSLVALNQFASFTVHADLLMTAPPRESPKVGQAIYGPLANHLSRILGESVYYEHPQTWQNYAKNMRNDKYDIVFDGPHFAAWRIDTLAAKPIVKLPGSLSFVLIAGKNDSEVKILKDLTGKTICTLPSPNLGALTLFSMFPNPARQPNYQLIEEGFTAVAKAFENHQCKAAIIRSTIYYKKLPAEFRAKTIVIKESKVPTNQGITVSNRIDLEHQKLLILSLTKGEGIKATKPILERFSKNATAFEPAAKKDYIRLNLLKDNSIFGW